MPQQNCGWALRFALLRLSVCTYNSKSCVANSSYTPWWILFLPIHSDQHDMKMIVKIGFYMSYGTLSLGGICVLQTFLVVYVSTCTLERHWLDTGS